MKIQMIIEVDHQEELHRVLLAIAKGMGSSNPLAPTPILATTIHDPDVGKASAAAPADPKPDEGKKAQGSRKKQDPAAAASGSPAPSPTTTSPAQSASEQSGGALTQPEGAAVAPTPAAKKDPVSAAAGAASAVTGLPDAVRNTTSMRDLLTYLAEHGVDSMDAMVAACVTLQKDVPILAKVPKVDERVRRACEVLQLFPEKAAEEPAA